MSDVLKAIGPGDRVTIRDRFGATRSGKAVMRHPRRGEITHWVLNMGGGYGTPGIANADNIVKVRKAKRPGPWF